MRFIICISWQLLLINGALQCFQARLEIADQGIRDVDNTYNEPRDENFIENEDLVKRSFDENGKRGSKENAETKEEDAVVDEKAHEESEKRQRALRRRMSDKQRRRLRPEGMRSKHKLKLDVDHEESDSQTHLVDDEPVDQDRETAHYYLTKDSDIRNISASMLGPGPVSIAIVDPTTHQVPLSRSSSGTTPAAASSTMKVEGSLRTAQHLALADFGSASLVDEHNNGNKRRSKSHVEEFDQLNDDETMKHPKKEDGSFRKHSAHFHREGHLSANQRDGHKRRKHKLRKDTAQKKGMGKFYQRDEGQFTNLSTINRSFKHVARKQGDFKNRVGPSSDFNVYLDEKEGKDRAQIIADKLSKEELEKINFLNSVHETDEDQSALRDENVIENERMDTRNMYRSNNPQGGIKSKIEHGDWVYQVTLLPLPDYNVRKRNRTNYKLFPFRNRNNIKDSSIEDKEHDEDYFVERAEELENGPNSGEVTDVFVPDKLKNQDEEVKSKRDIESRAKRHNLKLPKTSSFFNHNADTKNDKADEPVFDVDSKTDDESHSSFKEGDEKKYGNSEYLEKEDYHDGYDPNFSSGENGKAIPINGVGNQTTYATSPTTCAPTRGVNKELLSKTTKKFVKQKSTLKPSDQSETAVNNRSREFEHTNTTKDPYESFLCGQLADSFVEEVLKKVKMSRKMSRELGYTNETEETCDRCIELKPLKLPDSVAMRNSLGQCSKSRTPPPPSAGGCSTCCSVPKPMGSFLDLLVSYERENENTLYSRIQDDSTFIFTGDYPEAMLKDKMKEKVEHESSFHKDNIDRPHLAEDLNEEKNEEKNVYSDVIEKPKEKLAETDSGGGSLNNDVGNSQEKQSEVKRTMRTFGENKIEETKEEQFPDIDENLSYDDVLPGYNPPILDPISKANSNEKLLSNPNVPVNEAKQGWKVGDNNKKEYSQVLSNSPKQADEKFLQNYERFYGKNHYDYNKQNPPKGTPIRSRHGYRPKYGQSPVNTLPKKNRERYSFYNIPNSNRMPHTKDRVENYFAGYPVKKFDPYKKTNLNERFMYQSKYDSLYDENGEYSLYPNLEGRSVEEAVVPESYRVNEDGNTRMVKRYAETQPSYDDEQNVFFEIPDIEYDLY